MSGAGAAPLFADLPGQDRAVRQLRAAAVRPVHAYLFLGPPGVGKRSAALSFAAALLAAEDDLTIDAVETRRRVLVGTHPDSRLVEREGASISANQLTEIIRLSVRSPLEGSRKVLILDEFDLVAPAQVPMVLKTIEEPPASTIFILLAETLPAHFVTIASRCVRIEFAPLTDADIAGALVAGGTSAERAAEVTMAAGGRLDRARLLAGDDGFVARRAAWLAVPSRLDGSGAAVAVLVEELDLLVEPVLVPLRQRQLAEIEAQKLVAETTGERLTKGDTKALEDKHKREIRRLRVDELRSGFTALTSLYRDRLVLGGPPHVLRDTMRAMEAVVKANEMLIRNPNETLLLQDLFLRLSPPR